MKGAQTMLSKEESVLSMKQRKLRRSLHCRKHGAKPYISSEEESVVSTRLHICSDDDCMNDSQTGGVCIKHGANQTMAKARRKHEGRTMLQEESLLESHGVAEQRRSSGWTVEAVEARSSASEFSSSYGNRPNCDYCKCCCALL